MILRPVMIAAVAATCSFILPSAVSGVIAADASAASHEFTVTLSNMSYGKIPSGLKVGDTLIFVNQDTVPHSVTARDHSFDVRIDPKKSGRVVLQKAGKIQIYCIYHPMMTGALTVADS